MLLENKVAVIYGGGGPIGGAAARAFAREGARVFLHFGGSGPQTLPGLGGFKVALDALEGLRRQWAVELGGPGIRVLTLKTGGIPETIDQSDAGGAEIAAGIAQGNAAGTCGDPRGRGQRVRVRGLRSRRHHDLDRGQHLVRGDGGLAEAGSGAFRPARRGLGRDDEHG
jgi:NAD(P)-dependent dehydrogenase (short-subunit alcohol dehydrogenase family)